MINTIIYMLWCMSFQACILIIIVLAARQLLKRYSGLYTRLLWLLVTARLLCPVFIETDFSLLPELSAPSGATGTAGEAENGDKGSQNAFIAALPAARQLADGVMQQFFPGTAKLQFSTDPGMPLSADIAKPQVSSDAGDRQLSGGSHTSGAQNIRTPLPAQQPVQGGILPDAVLLPGKQKLSFSALLPALYLLGVIVTAFVFSSQFFLLKRRISTAVCENGNVWLCENITSPFVVGIFRPRIILPYHIKPEAKVHVLSHEQTHIRHCDPALHFSGLLCLCLHWWNPFVWLAVHRMNQDMEMFCDESTLRLAAVSQRKDYAKTLLSFAEQQSSLHAGPAFGESNTERRIKNIMKKRKKNFLVSGLVLLLVFFCSAAFMTVPKTAKSDGEPAADPNDSLNVDGGPADSGNLPNGGDLPDDGDLTNGGTPNTADSVVFTVDTFSALQRASLSIPDFTSEQDMDAAFWKHYLFYTFTGISAYGSEPESTYIIESVTRYCEQYGFDITYNKIMANELDELIRTLFGKALSEFISDPRSLADGNNIIYEAGVYGCYYIATSDSSDFSYGMPQTDTTPDGKTRLVFPKYPE
ncbi:MAG: hypothetical protein K2N94_07680, partial [Lachnospiraceae bacterium]|nr:hypothetical protein [Lachnospiraceae bacterium]